MLAACLVCVFFPTTHATADTPREAGTPIIAPAKVAFANRPLSLASVSEQPIDIHRGLRSMRLPDGMSSGPVVSNRPIALRADDRDEAGVMRQRSILLASAADADEPPQSADVKRRTDDSIVATLEIVGQNAERITVSKNSMAVLSLKVPIDRAEVADPGVAEILVRSPTQLIIAGKEVGSTQLVLWIGQEQRAFNVSVELDLTIVRDLIKSFAPTADVRLHSVNGTIVLSGFVPDAQTGERVVDLAALAQGGEVRNQLTVAGVQQTMLRVVVAEVNKDAIRQLGINWAMGGSDWSRDFFFANNLGQLNPTVFGSSGIADVLTGQQLYGAAAVGNMATTNVTFGFPRAEFQVFLNALRENDLAKTLAEPNLVAISGQTATFLAGGEVPIPVAQGGAVSGAITIKYKEFGVRLAFTPTVMSGQIVRLHVMSEVSEALPGQQLAGGLPLFTFNTRRVESTVECGNGQTFAIAGLLDDRVRAAVSKIPGLGDIPILGALFSSTRYQKSETELLVLVTPQLVEPLDPHQVPPPPGGLMTDPNDHELFVLGKLEGEPIPMPSYDQVPRDDFPVNTRPGDAAGWPASQLALRGPWGIADFREN
ncbi:MAG: type II and III secretion system protein family protein [Planctomycetota bacterium]